MPSEWFVMIPPSYVGKSAAEKELVDLVVQYSAASDQWQKANSGQIVGGQTGLFGQFFLGEGDQQLVRWQGPFATQAEARAAAKPRQQSPNPVNDAVNAAQNANIPGLTAIGDFFSRLTKPALWLRVAEGVLGLLLLGLGLNALLHNPAGKAIKAAPKVVPV
jgi:hypothetical protein